MRMLTVHLNRRSLSFFAEVVIELLLIGLHMYGASLVVAEVAASPKRAPTMVVVVPLPQVGCRFLCRRNGSRGLTERRFKVTDTAAAWGAEADRQGPLICHIVFLFN